MTPKKKIVFISHDSNLTGAPILLLNLIELVVGTGQFEIETILARGGILEDRFRKFGNIQILKPSCYGKEKAILGRIRSYISYKKRLRYFYSKIVEADIVFNNTVVNGKLLPGIRKKGIPVITYIHELDKVFDYFNHDNSSSLTIQYSSHLFYPSLSVKHNLLSRRSVIADKLSYLPYYLGPVESGQRISIETFNNRLPGEKIIPSAKFYVVGMGTANDRKGIDLFLETCRHTIALTPNVCFVWIGGFDDEKTKETTLQKIQENNLQDNFIVTGTIPYSIDNLGPFDLFFLSSREDPYPLVVLEAAVSGIPTLYFTDSGGIGEFVQQDAGWGIEQFDTSEAASLIADIINKPALIEKKGKCAFERVKKIHGDGSLISDIFVNTIKKITTQ